MVRQLPLIKQAIDGLSRNPAPTPSRERWQHFLRQMAAVDENLYVQFKEHPDHIGVWDAQNFHVDLVQLIDVHTPADARTADPPPLARLLETLAFCESKFQVPMDTDAKVPLRYERQAHARLRGARPAIANALRDKEVNPVLIDKVSHGFELILGQPEASMDYATYRYLDLLLPALAELSHSTLTKDWNLRLFRFFVQYNFNHMGIYNWWERETEQGLRGKAPIEELEHLHRLANDIGHIDQKTTLAYEPWRQPLKTQLLDFIESRRRLLTDKNELREEMQRHVLIINLPADEHNVHFNEDYEAGTYKAYPSKEKASEAYVKVIRGADGVELSAHSLRKADKAKYYGAADRVDEKLSDKRRSIFERYGLTLSSHRRK